MGCDLANQLADLLVDPFDSIVQTFAGLELQLAVCFRGVGKVIILQTG